MALHQRLAAFNAQPRPDAIDHEAGGIAERRGVAQGLSPGLEQKGQVPLALPDHGIAVAPELPQVGGVGPQAPFVGDPFGSFVLTQSRDDLAIRLPFIEIPAEAAPFKEDADLALLVLQGGSLAQGPSQKVPLLLLGLSLDGFGLRPGRQADLS